jgi:cell division protein FtsL
VNVQTKTAVLSLALAMLVVISAIACVFSRHESRMQFTKLQSLISQRDALEVDWGRLQIEQSTWSTHSRVERLARKSMAMRNPAPEEILVVRQ